MTRKTVAAALVSTALSAPAWALPRAGDAMPDASVEDADGRRVGLAAMAGKPVLVIYEDRGSSGENQALKDDLAKLAAGDRYRGAVALFPVADVHAYDFWPARGFVKDAIRAESRRVGTAIYCDWTGRFGSALGVTRNTSNVVLAGRDGKVLFARAGALSEDDRARLIRLLRAQLGP
jgi:hypothetical protein